MCELSFSIALWIIYIRSFFSLVLLKIFWNFRNSSRKNQRRSSRSQVFYKIDVKSWKKFVFKKVSRLGVRNKLFEWLAANEFLSNSKNYLRFSCVSISCFFIFFITFFPPNGDPLVEKRSIQSNYQEVATKRCFCRIFLEIFRYECWFMK